MLENLTLRRSMAAAPVRALRAAIGLALAVGAPSLGQAAAQVASQPCARILDPGHLSAIAAAVAWRDARWAHQGRQWSTAYEVPPPPKAPLGIGSLARGHELGAAVVPSAPIAGIASVSQFNCIAAPSDPAGPYIVQFVGRGLRFKENAGAWSHPLRTAMLHSLVVARPAADIAWIVSEQPEAHTALLPGARLTLPAPAAKPQVAAATTRPRR